MIPDKFDIFSEVMRLESNTNYYKTRITAGNLLDVIMQVQKIHHLYDESLGLTENVAQHFKRKVSPTKNN